jgi:type IV pilus assembly protein PilV
LLEVLIALVVLSIGLLGIAALQGVGLRSSHGAALTSQANLLAYDMADRIRANRTGFANTLNVTSNCTEPAEAPTSPAELAAADVAEWSCSLEELLPAGSGRIVGSPGADPRVTVYTITIEWQDRQVEDEEDVWSVELEIEV